MYAAENWKAKDNMSNKCSVGDLAMQCSWLCLESTLIQTLSTLDDAQHTRLEHGVNYAQHLLGKFGNRGHN